VLQNLAVLITSVFTRQKRR